MGATLASKTGGAAGPSRSAEHAKTNGEATSPSAARSRGEVSRALSMAEASLEHGAHSREVRPGEREVRIVQNLANVDRIVNTGSATSRHEDVVVQRAGLIFREGDAAVDRGGGNGHVLTPVSVAELRRRQRRVGGRACRARQHSLCIERSLDRS